MQDKCLARDAAAALPGGYQETNSRKGKGSEKPPSKAAPSAHQGGIVDDHLHTVDITQ